MEQVIRLFPVALREDLRDCGIFGQGLEEIRSG